MILGLGADVEIRPALRGPSTGLRMMRSGVGFGWGLRKVRAMGTSGSVA